jgi:hypothetical protein
MSVKPSKQKAFLITTSRPTEVSYFVRARSMAEAKEKFRKRQATETDWSAEGEEEIISVEPVAEKDVPTRPIKGSIYGTEEKVV